MRICNLWRNVSVLLVAGCICCVMPSCSDDDAPAVIEAAQPCASAYELNEVCLLYTSPSPRDRG